jgi:hypothetical protein
MANVNSATGCTAIGYEALLSNTDNVASTALGCRAGKIGGGGFQNTFLGADTVGGSFNNSTAIGSGATITASNQVVLGRTTESVFIPGTTASTSTTTGALQVTGGAGIGGNVYTGGIVDILSTESSTSTTTGALQVAGGAGIVGNVFTGGIVDILSTENSISTTTGALQVAGGAGIQGNIFLGGNLITNGDISCNGNINIRFPINTTYRALPTFTDTQIGNIRANVFTTSQNILHGNIVYPFNILYNIPPGIWIANYTAYIATSNNVGGGNITFGMSTVTPAFTGTTMNVFPMDLATSYGVNKMPIPTTAASITAASGPFILSGTAVIPFNTTGTISMVGNIHGFVAAGNAVTRSVLTATRIA